MTSEATISIQTYDKSELEAINLKSNHQPPPKSSKHLKASINRTISNDSYHSSFNDKEQISNPITLNEEIIFSMGRDQLKYDLKTVMKACPALVTYLSQIETPNAKITINLPQWITRNALFEYFVYFKKDTLVDSSALNYFNIFRLSDCFENTVMLSSIIRKKIIPTLSFDSALLFLQESFEKIEQNNLNYNWYELFSTTKGFISDNIIQYIQSDNEKLSKLRKELLEEIIEHHILSATDIEAELVEFLMRIRHCDNIYDLIAYEAISASSDDNARSLADLNYLLIQYSLRPGNIYQELNKKFNKQIDATFFVYYKASDDIFRVNFKMHCDDKAKLFSFSFLCFFEGGDDHRRFTSHKVLSNSKGNVSILQLSHFKQSNSTKLVIHMKLNAIHSFTIQFLTMNFRRFSEDVKVVKLPLMLLRDMLLIGKEIDVEEEEVVKIIALWLSDEINANDEALNRLLEIVDWKKVKKSSMYAFIVQHASLIERTELYRYFIDEMNVEEELIIGVKQANFGKLLIENSRLKKTIELLKNPQLNASPTEDLSEIKRSTGDNLNLFSESDKDEAKQFLSLSKTIGKHSFNRNRMRNKGLDMNMMYESMQQIQLNESKTLGGFNQPVKTIEYEVNSVKSKAGSDSLHNDMLHTPTSLKISQLKDNKPKKGTFGNILNTMQSCSLQGNILKTKETSTVTQKSSQSIQSDRSLSSFDQLQSKRTSLTFKKQQSDRSSKQRRQITIKKAKLNDSH